MGNLLTLFVYDFVGGVCISIIFVVYVVDRVEVLRGTGLRWFVYLGYRLFGHSNWITRAYSWWFTCLLVFACIVCIPVSWGLLD